MNGLKFLQRIELLLNQSRYEDAKRELETYLSNNPSDFFARRAYVVTLINCGDHDLARDRCEALLAEYPESLDILHLSIEIDLADEYYDKAESKVDLLKQMSALDEETFVLEARVKMGQRNYDKALLAIGKALEYDANNIEALNLKIALEGQLGKSHPQDSINHALKLNPENPYTIANHAYQLLRDGKVEAALERSAEALQKDPNNPLGRQVMADAMRSRFWLFRLFFKYGEFISRLTAKSSWAFIIGVYIGYRIIRSLANQYPILLPLVYLLFGLFILSWLIQPIANLYLYFNKYGKLLLDKDDTKMALSTGAALAIAIPSFCLYIAGINPDLFLRLAAVAGFSAIPLSSYLSPTNKSNQQRLTFLTFGIIGMGLLALFFNIGLFIILFFLGIFAYQWIINGILIKEGARVID